MAPVIKEKEEKPQSNVAKFIAKYFSWLILIIFLVILAFGFFVLIFSKYNEIIFEAKANDIKYNEDYSEKNKKELEDLDNLISAYKNIKPSYIDKINKIIPQLEIKEKILTQIESLVISNGLLLKSVSIELVDDQLKNKNAEDQNKEPEKIKKYKISLNILGVNYNNLKNVLKVFESNLRLMDVQSVSFSTDKDEVSIELYTYIFND